MIRAFHKPYGVLSQFRPVEGKRSLLEFPELKGSRAVGRLDEDSEGLLLVSDDPIIQTALTTPGRVEKVYWAQVERCPDETALQALRAGVELRDGLTLPARARLLPDLQLDPRDPPIRFRAHIPTCWLELTLKQGKNRQVRRMTAAVGHPTLRLIRVQIGPIKLEDLQAGHSRSLNADEERWIQGLRSKPEDSRKRTTKRPFYNGSRKI